MPDSETSRHAVFHGKRIRKTLHDEEWWFPVIDVIEVPVGGDRPRKYWNDQKKKLIAEGCVEVSEKIGQLKIRENALHHLEFQAPEMTNAPPKPTLLPATV